VILTFYKVRSILCSPASIPILSLALADFILAVTAMPFGIAANASRSWYFSHSVCNWYAFTHSVAIDKQGIVKITLVVWGICIRWGILP